MTRKLSVYHGVGSASWWDAGIEDTPMAQHQPITKHHMYSITRHRISDEKNTRQENWYLQTSMAIPSRQHNFAETEMKFTSKVVEVGLFPPETGMKSNHQFFVWPRIGIQRKGCIYVWTWIHMCIYMCVCVSVLAGTLGSMCSIELRQPQAASCLKWHQVTRLNIVDNHWSKIGCL